jgi:hypothetical protein
LYLQPHDDDHASIAIALVLVLVHASSQAETFSSALEDNSLKQRESREFAAFILALRVNSDHHSFFCCMWDEVHSRR